jgi:hypothetical protein
VKTTTTQVSEMQMEKISNRRVLIGTVAALVANVAIYLIGSASGATWNVGMPITVGLPMVAGATVVPMLIGGQAVKLIGSWKASLINVSAWLVLVFSIAGSPSGWIASGNAPTGLSLGAMHVAVGLAWFFSIKPKHN